MLIPVTLALFLAAQPAPAAPAAQPAQPTAPAAQQRPADWLEQFATERLKQELTPPLTEMGWPEEDRAWFLQKILPSCSRPRLKVAPEAADQQRLDRLRPRNNPSDTLVRNWVNSAYAYATAAWAATSDLDQPGDALADGLKPGLLKLRFDTHYKATAADRDAAATRIATDLAEVLADPAFKGENARAVAMLLAGLRKPSCDLALLNAAAQKYAARPDADKWFADFFTATVEKELAWDERGTRAANQTTDKQFQGFAKRLENAEAALTRAHAIHPDWPDAARAMITIAMGQGQQAGKQPVDWYDLAVKAVPNDPASGVYLSGAASPKWAGQAGWALTYRLLQEVAACEDHRSAFPSVAVNAVIEAAGGASQNLPAVIKHQDVYDLVKKALTPYLTMPAGEGGITPDTARTWLMLFAYHAQQSEDALAILNTPGFRPRPPNTTADISPQFIRYLSLMNAGPESEAISKAEQFFQKDDVDAAERELQSAASKGDAGPAADLVASRLQLIARLRQAAKGEPADLSLVTKPATGPAQSALFCWPASKGWNARNETLAEGTKDASVAMVFSHGGTAFYGGTEANLYMPVSATVLNQKYELAFDAVFEDAGRKVPSSLDFNVNRDSPGTAAESYGLRAHIDALNPCFDPLHSANPPKKTDAAAPLQTVRRHIRILVDGWKGELWCDGELKDWSNGPASRDGSRKPGPWLSLGGNAQGDGDARIEHLTIVALAKPLEDRAKRGGNAK